MVIEQFILNCGPYPLSTWLNSMPLFTTEMDEIAKGTHIMEGMYELQKLPTGETVKVFESQFDPPEDSDKVHVSRFAECSPDLHLITDIEDAPMLLAIETSEDDFNGLLTVIN